MGLHEFDFGNFDYDEAVHSAREMADELGPLDDEMTCEHGEGPCPFCDELDEPAPFPCCGGIGSHNTYCG